MIVFLIIGTLAVFLSFLDRFRNKGFKYGLEMAFVLLTSFLVIRYEWGNDYHAYLVGFQNISSIDFSLIFNFNELNDYFADNHFEIGWIILNILCAPIGFFGMVALLTIFQCTVMYFFIKRNVKSDYYWFAVFIYVFTYHFMLIQASMMRQAFSMTIVLCAYPYIIKKKIFKACLLILFASFFHRSALILLPLVFGGYMNLEFSAKNLFILFFTFIFIFLLKDDIGNYLKMFITENFSEYDVYIHDETGSIKLISLVGNISIIIFIVYFSRGVILEKQLMCWLVLFAISYTFINPFSLSARVMYYFLFFEIVLFPSFLSEDKNFYIKFAFVFLLITMNIRGIIMFFNSSVWERFLTYNTIFMADKWY